MGILNFFQSNKGRAVSQASIQEIKPNTNAGTDSVHEVRPTEVKVMDNATYLASDEKAWLRYLSQPLRPFRKPGVSIKEERDLWFAARARQSSIAS